jgi:hypothetical protein
LTRSAQIILRIYRQSQLRLTQKLLRICSLATPLEVSSSVIATAISFCPHSTAATPDQSLMPSSCRRGTRLGEGVRGLWQHNGLVSG